MRSPDLTLDVTPLNDWRVPTVLTRTMTDLQDIGPLLVTIEYDVAPERAADFTKTMCGYARIRRRDGASE